MQEFYAYVYPQVLPIFLLAIALTVASVMVRKRGARRSTVTRLMLGGIVLDAVLAGIYLTSFGFRQYGSDLLMGAVWLVIGAVNYRTYRRL